MDATKITSYAAGLDTPELEKLRQKHTQLLDTVDQLRDNNLGKYVELPQIVVVGDQSSGKSSVLSAIAQVEFPSRGNVCTRFATELSLRRADVTKLEATIRPHVDATEDIKKDLEGFGFVQSEFKKLSELIEAASKRMNIADGGNYYSKHVLNIKISGPDVPQLTLVDLPGFYDYGRDNQPIEFAPVVKELAKGYMEKQNSIILVIIAASHTIAMQGALEITKDFSERALGIVTKPDRMPRGGDSEKEILDLLDNRGSSTMRYGWHVLRNVGEGQMMDFEARDKQESALFSQSPWTNVPEDDKGIAPLRKKLCDVLMMHIASKLPEVATRINSLAAKYERSLANLPEARNGIEGCQRYLLRLTDKFVQIASQATGAGERTSDFFGAGLRGVTEDGLMERRNLRARICGMNQDFTVVMSLCGCKRIIDWRDAADGSGFIHPTIEDKHRKIVHTYRAAAPKHITQKKFETEIEKLATLIRGNELPGSEGSTLAMPIFHEQATPWGFIASRHIELVLEETRSVIEEILTHITENDESTRDNIVDIFIEPFFKDRRSALLAKVEELLPVQHKSRFPVALEEYFKYKVAERQRERHQRKKLKQAEQAIQGQRASPTQSSQTVSNNGSEDRTIDRVLDQMAIYYDVRNTTRRVS